jgi:hypothetical protein
MTHGRVSVQSVGYFVLQFHDATDLYGEDYTEINRPINFAARYQAGLDTYGIPRFTQVDNTRGPMGGWLCIPPKSPRTLAQWGQAFAAKITTAGSPPKATVISTGNGSGWTTATDLDEFEVYPSNGVSVSVGDIGLVVQAATNGSQVPLFFQGGGSTGVAQKFYQIVINHNNGTYEGVEYDEPQGTPLVGLDSVTGEYKRTPLSELNTSKDVPTDHWVLAQPGVSTRTLSIDGVDTDLTVMWFSAPFGCS